MQQLIKKIYPDIDALRAQSEESRLQYFSERAILAPLNVDVDNLNNVCLDQINDTTSTYSSVDVALDAAGGPDYSFPTEYLNTINLSGMANHNLNLKVGSPIILIRSLNTFDGLCNGTRLIVTALRERVIEAKILSGTHRGQTAFIPRIFLVTSSDCDLPFTLRRLQFPIRLAFAMTINKSQGKSTYFQQKEG
jgi:ATP-dependent DNA helicase PIF1